MQKRGAFAHWDVTLYAAASCGVACPSLLTAPSEWHHNVHYIINVHHIACGSLDCMLQSMFLQICKYIRTGIPLEGSLLPSIAMESDLPCGALVQDIFFGTGNLADLLPDIQADDFCETMQPQDEEANEPLGAEHVRAAGLTTHHSGSALGSDKELTPYNSSQFPLLVETEPDRSSQLHHTALSRTTRVALRFVYPRLVMCLITQTVRHVTHVAVSCCQPLLDVCRD